VIRPSHGWRHIGNVMLIYGSDIVLLPWTLYFHGPSRPASPATQNPSHSFSHPPLAKIDHTITSWV